LHLRTDCPIILIMTHATIIDQWPSIDALSIEVQEKRDTVRKWKERGRIPPRAWSKVLEAAQIRKLRGVTPEALMDGM
jgi:hypothetical protein